MRANDGNMIMVWADLSSMLLQGLKGSDQVALTPWLKCLIIMLYEEVCVVHEQHGSCLGLAV